MGTIYLLRSSGHVHQVRWLLISVPRAVNNSNITLSHRSRSRHREAGLACSEHSTGIRHGHDTNDHLPSKSRSSRITGHGLQLATGTALHLLIFDGPSSFFLS